ncbi:MAG TPA: hypothetical protein DIU07_11995 [Rhodobacteraceae bacterium]|nr:hypothetical protein [Paracoccaceae bacterium]
MTVIVSIIIGFAIGCFINYAITFRTGQARNIGICVGGALLGGALIPALLSMSSFWTALAGSVIGIVVVMYLWIRLAPAKA